MHMYLLIREEQGARDSVILDLTNITLFSAPKAAPTPAPAAAKEA